MSDAPKDGVDRRDFMTAAFTLVGASAALATNVGTANAQGTKEVPAAARSGTQRGTVYTGDVIQG